MAIAGQPLRVQQVNRKERRSTKSPRLPAEQLFAQADGFHRLGRLDEAQSLYRQVLEVRPRHARALHRLGLIAHQRGQNAAAVPLLRQAIAQDASQGAFHVHLALALAALGQGQEAMAACRQALALDETLVDAHCNLSVMALQMGLLDEAADAARRAIALAPALADAHNNLGNALMATGKVEQASACFARALERAPDFAEARANLGHALWRLGRPDDAAAQFEAALRLDPGLPQARAGLGDYFLARGGPDLAVAQFEASLAGAPENSAFLCGLSQARLALDDGAGALTLIANVLARSDTPDARRIFVDCARAMAEDHPSLRPLLLRALAERWCRPDEISAVCARLILEQPGIAPFAASGSSGPDVPEALAADPLLIALLCAAPNVDPVLERLLTVARRDLLVMPRGSAMLPFQAALARQCFINEYVFAVGEDESALAETARGTLSELLERGAKVEPALLLAVASYYPLHAMAQAARLLDRTWDPAVQAVLVQQVSEPQEEQALRGTIACPVAVRDAVSRAVRAQYEDNPYPRWVGMTRGVQAAGIGDHLRGLFPFLPLGETPPLRDILVAGCGTGRNALETARQFAPARVLAIDLSVTSLAYAKRKSAGVDGIDYLQMDLLDAPSMGRTFDLIEAVGVLHHLSDPFAGWRALLSCLKPGGFMRLGLYSRLARQKLENARSLVADVVPGGSGAADTGAIRRARQLLIARNDASLDVLERPDFYTVSNCRDLLFHVQEHCLTLDDIAGFLNAQGLIFLGFAVDAPVLTVYRQRFADDPAAVDLHNWQVLEGENPDIFSSMYEFWVRKA